MSFNTPIEDPSDALLEPSTAEIPKTRRCLRCEATFESRWAGERICGRCKGTAAWRQGMPASSHPSGSR